ncbi:MAG: hypothetical protein ACREKQ_11480 [Candidatus Rokuibacteriota bacterium]
MAVLSRAAGVLALGLGVCGAGTSTTFDFVTFDRIDYIRWSGEAGRELTRADLGVEFATVGCSIGEDVRGCSYGMDAGAAFLPAGTPMYALRGYATEFRLAASWRGRLFLYQAWRNPRAKVGGDLFDIAGRVREIDVRRHRGTRPPGAAGTSTRVTSPRDVEMLVGMILHGPVRRPTPRAAGTLQYWLTFWLADGTTLGRPYFADTGELMGGVVLPPEFRTALDRHLAD